MGRKGFTNGPSKLNTVRTFNVRRKGATTLRAGCQPGANRNVIPTACSAALTCSELAFRLIPSASKTSAEPTRLEAERLPCLATFMPAAAATKATAVEILNVAAPSPPVPQVSIEGVEAKDVGVDARDCKTCAIPANSAADTPLPPNQKVFQALIKSRTGGTPVVDVNFNGVRQFEMIVDTGASGTVITQQMASALGVVSVGKARANTASDRNVEFEIGYIDSIEVGGAVIKHVPVAIAPSAALDIGLLGQDFFSNYDVTIKRDIVEFRSP